MGLRVSGKNFAIGEAMRQHVHDRVAAAAGNISTVPSADM